MSEHGGRQPWLHDKQIAVCGNATALSTSEGSMGPDGTGLLVDDRLVVSRWELRLAGAIPVPIQGTSVGSVTTLWGCARTLGDDGPDPTVEVHTRREVRPDGLVESLTIISRAADPVVAEVELLLGGSGADLSAVKGGLAPEELLPVTAGAGGVVGWRDQRHETAVTTDPPAAAEVTPAGAGRLRWPVELRQGEPVHLAVTVVASRLGDSNFDAVAAGDHVDWSAVAVEADDRRLGQLVNTSLRDLQCLLLTDPDAPADFFAAAGSPWYLTLFGRDSLWTARLMLPFDIELSAGTLRTLARRQGVGTDPVTAEEPGKILHEVRRGPGGQCGGEMMLPPLYYGTVDATALWVIVLHDAWRQGLAEDEVRGLLPHLQRAMSWLTGAADNDLGLLRYLDTSGTGLSNQGWKDSGDSMRRRDGSIAPAPIALIEAQAYAVEAALGAARLFDAFGLAGAEEARSWAKELTERIHRHYWVEDERGRFLALAIDGDGRPVDGVGSNMGHVLGTGVLDPDGAAITVARLLSPELLGQFGIGTLSRDNPAYNPIGYHTGSVWTHDTAIALLGMVREGWANEAARVARGLVDVATPLGYRVPELFAGESVAGLPAPYPASCRPQAWSAASAVAIVVAVLGLEVDVPAGRVRVRPMTPSPFGPVRVTGLRYGAERFDVAVDGSGTATVTGLPDGVTVDIGRGQDLD